MIRLNLFLFLTSRRFPGGRFCRAALLLFLVPAGLTPLVACAQSASNFILKGNQLYKKEAFTDAEVDYKKALDKNKKSSAGYFNLGNSLYQQKRFPDAFKEYANSATLSKNPYSLSDTRYNMGNTYMAKKEWQKSIADFEKSLILNPKDADARYNLAYAQMMLKKQKSGGGGKKNQKNKKPPPPKKNSPQQKKNKSQAKPKPQPSKLTKQEARQLLDALAQQEQKVQDKKDKNKQIPPITGGPDW